MKKKFVLTLALVLMVAGTLVAATPLEVSGSFKAGYTFEAGNGIKAANDYKATINASVSGDFWKVTIANNSPLRFGEKDKSYYNMKADLFMTKALAEQGVDMGDLDITLHVGTGVAKGAPSVLADKADFRKDKGVGMTAGNNFGVTAKYSDMVEVYASADPTLKALPMVVGAKFMPVDGVTVAAGFSNDYTADGDTAMAVSAKADVAALADLDFELVATGEFLLNVTDEKNYITADVAGSYEGIGLWVAYQNDLTSVNKLAAEASYSTSVQKFDVSASFKADLGDIAASSDEKYTIAAGAKYAMGGATYALDAEYEIEGAFTLTPSVSISF